MNVDWFDLADVALLTTAYWLLDLLVRRDGWTRLLGVFGETVGAVHQWVWCLPLLAVAAFCKWSSIPEFDSVRAIAIIIAAGLCWKATTKDIDPVFAEPHWTERLMLPLAIIGIWFSPAFVFIAVYLLTHPFRLWEHHSTFPMRVMLAVAAFLMCCAVAPAMDARLFPDSAAIIFFVVTMQISHYVITAFAKAWLGPWPFSWITDNRLHHLAASAYSWGWAKFLPWHVWRRVIGVVKVIEKPMQMSALGIEALAPVAIIHPYVSIAFSLAWAGFHLGVFSLSGLLFWDWMIANIGIAVGVFLLPDPVTSQAFGGWALLASILFMILFPLRHKLWKPMPLGWWDTPFTQRMHWVAIGESGQRYGVYNNFMCPNERLYGKLHACFLSPERGITYHLGEVWKRDLRDAIRNAGPDLERLSSVRDRYGVEPRDQRLADNHVAYIKRFFWSINAGERKWVLPRGLRWLKAPGDQIFYWGDLPAFRCQERVMEIELIYREEYFDGEQLVRLTDQHVMTIEIDDSCGDIDCEPEPTPKQIDDLLLSVGEGKIIDVPKFAGGYVKGDDGKAVS